MNFFEKRVRKCKINFLETTSVEILRKNLIKFWNNLENFWNCFREVLNKYSEMWALNKAKKLKISDL